MAVAAVCIDRSPRVAVLAWHRMGNTAFRTFLDMLCALFSMVVEYLVIGELWHDIVRR
jgi:hypothetical protein